jgi:hypothetical protein
MQINGWMGVFSLLLSLKYNSPRKLETCASLKGNVDDYQVAVWLVGLVTTRERKSGGGEMSGM